MTEMRPKYIIKGFFPSKMTVNNIYSITVHFHKLIED